MASEKVKKENKKSVAGKQAEVSGKEFSPKADDKVATEKKAKTKKVTSEKEVKPVVKETISTVKSSKDKIKDKIATPAIKEAKETIKEKSSKKVPAKVDKETLPVNISAEVGTPIEVNAFNEKLSAEVQEIQSVKVTFQVRYSTRFGQKVAITGSTPLLGDDDLTKAFPLNYYNSECWSASVELPVDTPLTYKYCVINEDGFVLREPGGARLIDLSLLDSDEVLISDVWNENDFNESALYSTTNVQGSPTSNELFTHTFKVKVSGLPEGFALFVTGNTSELNNWSVEESKLLSIEANGDWTINLNIAGTASFEYKYGIYNVDKNKFVTLESGPNRTFYSTVSTTGKVIINDGVLTVDENIRHLAV